MHALSHWLAWGVPHYLSSAANIWTTGTVWLFLRLLMLAFEHRFQNRTTAGRLLRFHCLAKRAVRILVLSVALGCVSAAVTQAQDRSFWGRPTNPPDANRTDQRADEAARLYADARADIDAGQVASAQRRLEVLVARHPSSPLADVARRDLQRLYAGTLGAPAPALPMPAARTIQVPDQSRLAPAANIQIQTSPPPPSAQPTVPTPQRDASEDFRHLAGDRIFFADSSLDLGGRAKSALEAQAAWLIRYPGIEIVLEGHSDDHGSRDFNRALAEKRAQAVKLRLNDLGVSSDRMSVSAFGREQPVADCPEPHCTAQNRRVVTIISRVPAGLTFDITRGSSRGVGGGVPVR
jgi:peptidoglycan-associated lipoprotein